MGLEWRCECWSGPGWRLRGPAGLAEGQTQAQMQKWGSSRLSEETGKRIEAAQRGVSLAAAAAAAFVKLHSNPQQLFHISGLLKDTSAGGCCPFSFSTFWSDRETK